MNYPGSLVRRSPFLFTGLVLLFLASAGPSLAQQGARISGAVKNEDGKPVPGLVLRFAAQDEVGMTVDGLETNKKGKFIIPNMRAGLYRLELETSGYRVAHIELEIRAGRSSVHDSLISPDTKQAENFIAGTGMERIANLLDALCARCSPPIPCFADEGRAVDGRMLSDLISSGSDSTAARAARFVGDLGGHALARLMTVLHDGTAVKSAPYPNWSPAEIDRIRGVTRFVLGGGISRTPLGQRIIESARERLAHWPELEIFVRDQVADAGALGAFSLIPPQVRRTVEGTS